MMSKNDTKDSLLDKLIAQGEHCQQDFKYKVMDAAKLAKSVSAFANTKGGRLLIGVRDNGEVSGVTSEEEIFMMQTAARKYCVPATDVQFQTVSHHGKTVVICEVLPSDRKPVYALEDIAINHKTAEITPIGTKTAYIRIDDENIVASPVHLQIWREETANKGMVVIFSENEHVIIRTLKEHPDDTLNHIVRYADVSRRKVILILARLIRFGIAECYYANKQFLFHLL